MTIRASIVGGSGYAGGELARLLLSHSAATLHQVASRSLADKPLHTVHPNLRGQTGVSFTTPDDIEACDVLFLCMPHGESASQIDRWRQAAPVIVDLSADLRLRSATAYREWYGKDHPRPELLGEAVYGLPELTRTELRDAKLISGVGCNATAMNLALLPLAWAGLIDQAICDIKVGSSEGGASASTASHHPERSGAMRSYAPAGHRHASEVHQALGDFPLHVSVTAVEMVRGVLCTAHVLPTEPVDQKTLWRLFREAYSDEPFVRIVRDRTGLHRLPDPKILAGTNFADVGFEIDPRTGRIVTLCAIDNLVKGAAGSAIQSMNIAMGLDETDGLTFPGLHPI